MITVYVQQSVSNKRKIGNFIAGATNMAGKSSSETVAPKIMASNNNRIVSSQQVEVMSRVVQKIEESSSVEAVEQEQPDPVQEIVDVPTVVVQKSENPLASVEGQTFPMPTGMLAGRHMFHFSNCSDIKFSFGQ